ncbi:extracellular solute-binding protein [Pectinatus haikarae]|uniref:Iron(III) transport system substrate-binding protein n=1 Tax=Pectinatus haikarae TaxID=349096 RepID=A0ABT9Y8J6_9FIRM|nr:extracellular solute-binding protein [Pectinatus haikarae]MDQ0203487.1 iron(III) transport system substrate-binding protein [Pectinatus haikarae]
MRRYIPLFFIVCSILLILLAVNTYWIYHTSDNRQITVTRNKITVYTTLPMQVAAPIAAEYEKLNKVKVNFVLLSEKELTDKMQNGTMPLNGQADIILAGQDVLKRAAALNVLAAFSSEQEDVVANIFKDKNNLWTGIWYDPIIFCANRDYLQAAPYIPRTWAALVNEENIRIGLTDFLASDTSANLFYAFIRHYGNEQAFSFLQKLHPKVLQYAKYLSTPVRMAGMGEVDISIAVQSEAVKYLNNNYPLVIIYPEDGTYYQVTGAALLKNAPDKAQASRFIQWLLGDDIQLCLQRNGFFFVPTNYSTFAYKTYAGKGLVPFSNNIEMPTEEQKMSLLDEWVKNIRLQ